VHNFHICRTDGITAAERLFGHAPPPLFEQVLARVPHDPLLGDWNYVIDASGVS